MRNSLRFRFTMIFFSLAILPQILTGIILGSQVFTNQEAASLALQQEIAAGMARRIEAFFSEREDELLLMDEVVGLGSMDRESQRNVLSNLILSHRAYQEVILLNATGQEDIHLSRLDVVLDSELQSRDDEDMFLFPLREKKTYYGPVKYDSAIREPLINISVPLLDRRSGEVQFVLIGSLRFKAIWELIANLELPSKREVFVIDESGWLVAHRNPTVVLQNTQFDLPEMDGRGIGLTGQTSIIASYTLQLGQQNLFVVSQETLSSALALAFTGLRFTIAMILLSLVPIAALVVLVDRQIIRPIVALAASARAISAGEQTRDVRVVRSDELGDLALAFNNMMRQLSELIGSL